MNKRMTIEELIKYLNLDVNDGCPALYVGIDYGKHENFEISWGLKAVKTMLQNTKGFYWNGQWTKGEIKGKNIRLPSMADYETLFEYIGLYGGAIAAESPFGSWRYAEEYLKFLNWAKDHNVEWRSFNPKQTNSHRHDVKEKKPLKEDRKEESHFIFDLVFVKGVSTGKFRLKEPDANGVFHARNHIPQIIQKRVNMQIEEVVDDPSYKGLNDALPLGIRPTLNQYLIPIKSGTRKKVKYTELVGDVTIDPWFKDVCEEQAGVNDKITQAVLWNAIFESSTADRAAVTAIYALDPATIPLIEKNEKGETETIGRKSFYDHLVQLFGNRQGNKVSSEYNMRLAPMLARIIICNSTIFSSKDIYKGVPNKAGKAKAKCVEHKLRNVCLKLGRKVIENYVFDTVREEKLKVKASKESINFSL
jgi:hypothetical protein